MTPKEALDQLARAAAELRNQLEYLREIGVNELTARSRPPAARYSAKNEVPLADSTGEHAASPISISRGKQQTFFSEIGNPSNGTQDSSLESIRADIGECTRCKLSQNRTNIVFGEGSPQARLMFVGEGPGADEDRTGRPFVGRAGQLLDRMIEAMKFKREEVYIANVVKCRPPGNRTPERDEVSTCEPFLFRQIAVIKPAVIVTLGLPALQCLLKTSESISRARGNWREWNGIKVMPTFHPAYLLRSPDKKRETWEDLLKVMQFLLSST